MVQFLRNAFRSIAKEEKGNVLILVSLSAFLLILSIGAAIDMTRAQILQLKMYSALDAANLAAGAAAANPPAGYTEQTWVNSEVSKFFNANFPTNYLGSSTVTIPSATLSNGGNTIDISASTVQSTSFMAAVGTPLVRVAAASEVTRASYVGMELVLALDNTGSMANPVDPSTSSTSKLVALQNAATELVNILYGTNTTLSNSYIGIVPFTQAVNIGTSHSAWTSAAANGTFPASAPWFGCVEARTTANSLDTSDAVPNASGTYGSASLFPQYLWANGPTLPASATITGTISGNTLTISAESNIVTANGLIEGLPAITSGTGVTLSKPNSSGNLIDAPAVTITSQLSGTPGGVGTYQIALSPNTTQSNINTPTTMTLSSSTDACTGVPGGACNIWGSSSTEVGGAFNGPNAWCPQPLTQMTTDKATILAGINSMTAQGDTLIDLGLAWAYRMLSPNWQGLWGGEMNTNNLPLAYNTPNMEKVVILMTDGMNYVEDPNIYPGVYDAYGYLDQGRIGGATTQSTAVTQLDTYTESVCDAMKANGIIIYTIGFGTTDDDDLSNPTSVNGPLLKYCATDINHYFLAPTNAALSSAFQQIGNQLANLRISK
jgi:Flp pilus assembly protein TadG